jgi:hypothetical protein
MEDLVIWGCLFASVLGAIGLTLFIGFRAADFGPAESGTICDG